MIRNTRSADACQSLSAPWRGISLVNSSPEHDRVKPWFKELLCQVKSLKHQTRHLLSSHGNCPDDLLVKT